MMAPSGFQRFWVKSHSIKPRALRQRTTHNIDMAVAPEKGGEPAYERLKSAFPGANYYF
jgi:hypothetical protein